ncbi:MAG: hypothetical protein ACTSYB_18160 [Candidatus Helarchaeota archaeon]
MFTPRERIDAALNCEDPLDKLPRFEIGAVTLPLMKVMTRYYQLPAFMRQALRQLDLIREIVYYLKKFFVGIEVKKFKPKRRFKVLPKRLITRFVNLSRTDENFERIVKTVYRVPIKLGYDSWGFPNPLLLEFMGKILRKDTGEYGICFVDGKIWDIDLATGDMIEIGLLYEDDNGEKMMDYYTQFMKNFDFERHYRAFETALNQKIGKSRLIEQIVPILFIRGLVSTWLYVFPTRKMNLLFRNVFEEYRRKGAPGRYGHFLKAKTKFLMKHVDYLAKLDLPAILLGDDQADTHGPFFRTAIYEKVYKPLYFELAKHAHTKGIKVILHSDGRFKTNPPDGSSEEGWDFIDNCIIAQGMDAWHSVEMDANDVYEIKEHIDRKLALLGTIDTKWLQFHGPQAVRKRVYRYLKRFLKRGGLHGLIPGTDNSIINKTRIESWFSMIRTIDDFSAKYIKH